MSNSVRDMTTGRPWRHIVAFALPLMLGNLFQQFYTMTDAAIVGRFAGVQALAAIGAVDWLSWLLFGIVTGFTQGFSILVAQCFGAQDERALRKAVCVSVELSAALTLFFTGFSVLTARWMLRLMDTPADVFGMSLTYLMILYCGMPVAMAYNLSAAILRALGNSRAPLMAMVLASVTNIGLDLLFVMGFHWSVAGAAAATVISEGVASAVCLLALRRVSVLRMDREDWRYEAPVARELMRLSAPMALQNGIIALGGVVVQRVVNGFGFVFVAGFTATNKLYGLLEVAATSFGYSMATFSGQNLGAGRLDRIRLGTRTALLISLGTALAVSALMFLGGRGILGLFISAEEAAAGDVLDVAVKYLYRMAAALFVLYFLYVYRSALQGMGDTVAPMLSGLVEMLMRMSAALILPRLLGRDGIYFAEVAAWFGATLLLGAGYYVRIARLERARGRTAA